MFSRFLDEIIGIGASLPDDLFYGNTQRGLVQRCSERGESEIAGLGLQTRRFSNQVKNQMHPRERLEYFCKFELIDYSKNLEDYFGYSVREDLTKLKIKSS